MVPALFERWADRVADAAKIVSGQRVLDVACGTGILARKALARTGPGGLVTGVDPGPGMLAVAQQLAPDVTWHQGVAEALPFADDWFDVVVSQFGLMFFADRQEALRQALRVLKPRSRMAFAVWDGLDNTPAYAAEVSLLQRMAGRQAADALRAPFVLGDRDGLATMFERAGVASVDVATMQGTARFPSVRVMVEADLRGWLPVMGVVLPDEQIEHILTEAEQVLKPYVMPNGTVEFDSPAHIVTGTKP
jgi:SAM-dependent methyltransferase